ncbi:response regulator [Streptomyces violascens]|uniref:response regulator n=1 Tax=Streptomyces violascens TaxID=67381 RepID=UPI0037BB8A3A
MIQVLVCDDSELVRRGLSEVINASGDLHVVAQAWDGRSAVDYARRYSPDLALLDIRMPGMDGLTATRQITGLPRPPRVVILTTFCEDEYVDEAVRAGAAGFLLKDTPPDILLRALRLVAAGHATLDPAVTGHVLRALSENSLQVSPTESKTLDALTERDIQLLRLIGRGLTNADIGATLHLTEGTVKGRVSRLLAKIGADNRVQAARLAYRAGLER